METSGIMSDYNTNLRGRVSDLCKLCPSLFTPGITLDRCIKCPTVWKICWIFNPNEINSSFYALHSTVQNTRLGSSKPSISLVSWYEQWVQQAADEHRQTIYVPIAILVEEKSRFPLMIFAGNNKKITYFSPYVDYDVDEGTKHIAYEFNSTLNGVEFEMLDKILLTERVAMDTFYSYLYLQMYRMVYQYTYIMYDDIGELYIDAILDWVQSYKPKKKK